MEVGNKNTNTSFYNLKYVKNGVQGILVWWNSRNVYIQLSLRTVASVFDLRGRERDEEKEWVWEKYSVCFHHTSSIPERFILKNRLYADSLLPWFLFASLKNIFATAFESLWNLINRRHLCIYLCYKLLDFKHALVLFYISYKMYQYKIKIILTISMSSRQWHVYYSLYRKYRRVDYSNSYPFKVLVLCRVMLNF